MLFSISVSKFSSDQIYLNKIKVSENDPAILLDWDYNVDYNVLNRSLAQLVSSRNQTISVFLQNVQTVNQLQEAFIKPLSIHAGRRLEIVYLHQMMLFRSECIDEDGQA